MLEGVLAYLLYTRQE